MVLSKEDQVRQTIIKEMCIQAARAPIYLTGHTVENSRVNISYKKYLGPDWIEEWEGASVIICNHISCLDAMVCVVE